MTNQEIQTPKQSNPGRILELDGIRGAAILLVVLYHYVAVPIPVEAGAGLLFTRQLFSNNWSGVDLFFVLSGFLITGILIDHRNTRHYFKVFYIRRLSRIFPLYYLFLSLFILAQYFSPRMVLFSQDLFSNPLPILPYYLYLQNFFMAIQGTFGNEFLAPTWSLAIEEHFYLLLPLLVRISPPKRLPLNLLFFISLSLILRTTLGQGTFIGFVLTPWRLDALMLGSLLAFLFRTPRLLQILSTYRMWIKIAFGGLFLFLVYRSMTQPLGSLNDLFIFALFYTMLIYLAISDPASLLARVFRHPALMRLGHIAYGIYLFHQLVNGVLHDLLFKQPPSFQDFPTAFTTLLAFLLTCLLAQLTYHAFEKRFIAFGHKYSYGSD